MPEAAHWSWHAPEEVPHAAQAHIGALAEMYSREGRERTPEESAEMLALMRAQRARGR